MNSMCEQFGCKFEELCVALRDLTAKNQLLELEVERLKRSKGESHDQTSAAEDTPPVEGVERNSPEIPEDRGSQGILPFSP